MSEAASQYNRFVDMDDRPPDRYAPGRPLPPYAFVPGIHPHPTRDPRGHSFGAEALANDIAFLLGVDLYNHGYFWEAHEAWERLWRQTARESARAAFLQGLIQCAAACMKLRDGHPEAARRISERACMHLARAVDGGADAHGLDLAQLASRFHGWIDAAPASADSRPRLSLGRVGLATRRP